MLATIPFAILARPTAEAALPGAEHQYPRMIDAFLASSEVAMVKYRLLLHRAFTVRTIIVEAPFTHAGQPKPLYVRSSFSDDYLARHNVRLVTVQFTDEALLQARCRFMGHAPARNGSSGSSDGDSALPTITIRVNKSTCAQVHTSSRGGVNDTRSLLEGQQRKYLNDAILEEIARFNRTSRSHASSFGQQSNRTRAHASGSHHLNRTRALSSGEENSTAVSSLAPLMVHVSDVDELLDPRLIAKYHAMWPACQPARLFLYLYSEHCHYSTPRWMRSLIARAELIVTMLHAKPDAELRFAHHETIAFLMAQGCKFHFSPPHVGVHFSYFFSTEAILSKLKSFLHAGDAPIRAVTTADDPEALVEKKVRACAPMAGRSAPNTNSTQRWKNVSYGVSLHRLPPVPGWPKHPSWISRHQE